MALRSWLESANDHSDFPLENLPFGVYLRGPDGRICVAIGDQVLDLYACNEAGLVSEWACTRETLNELMSRGREAASRLRKRIRELLTEGSAEREKVEPFLMPESEVTMTMPC